ncbi:hypothetical protein EMIT093MI4_70115 [Pseudomonas sp. IT-93MI4]
MLNVPALSRAGSLPHFEMHSNVGASLLANEEIVRGVTIRSINEHSVDYRIVWRFSAA